MLTPPQTITFLSDQTEATLIAPARKDLGDQYRYKFIKAREKLGMEFCFDLKHIDKLVKFELIKI